MAAFPHHPARRSAVVPALVKATAEGVWTPYAVAAIRPSFAAENGLVVGVGTACKNGGRVEVEEAVAGRKVTIVPVSHRSRLP